jgi:cation diffusion facilitator CzcD-associated flavoprotein CzcO
MMQSEKQVAVVGAGVAGLATAKVFLSQGHSVTIFERGDTLGGVWSRARCYPGLRLQTKRQCYTFSDFPMPDHYPEFPNSAQVYDYLVAYAKHFGAFDRIRLGSEVTSIEPRTDARGWAVRVRERDSAAETAHDFDFVVICNGVFATPKIPQFPGEEAFRANGGIVLHSSQVRDITPLQGRDVVVVGFGKSALDIAEAALANARSSTIVCRRVPWRVPHRVLGANIKHFILSRFTELWFPYPGMSRPRRILHRWFKPLVGAYWWLGEQVIGRLLGMRAPRLRPDTRLAQAGGCITLTFDNLAAVRDGRIGFHRGSVAGFTPDGIALADGRTLPAQTVVLATGFQVVCPFLADRERKLLFDASGAILLYRFLINPDIPDLAFNGYNGVGACQLSAELGASWLVRLMEGRLKVPSRAAMHAKIREEIDWRVRLLAPPHGVGYYVTPFTMGYFDQLLSDLGLPPADRHKPLFQWLFDPLDPGNYRDVLMKDAAAAPAPTAAHPGLVQDMANSALPRR